MIFVAKEKTSTRLMLWDLNKPVVNLHTSAPARYNIPIKIQAIGYFGLSALLGFILQGLYDKSLSAYQIL